MGIRFLPVTRTVPKPLLPILNVPVIEYAVREAAAAGSTDIAIVMSHGMEPVADYFHRQPKLEAQLKQRGEDGVLAAQIELASLANVITIIQDEQKGPGTKAASVLIRSLQVVVNSLILLRSKKMAKVQHPGFAHGHPLHY